MACTKVVGDKDISETKS